MSESPGDRHPSLPYARHTVDGADVAAVAEVLRSDWLTTGPTVEAFETAVAKRCGVPNGVAVSSGTAALHAAMRAIGVGAGDEVVVPAMTFVATANAVVFEGATPVFADVSPDTLLLDPASVAARIGPRTRAVVAVDYAGHPAPYAQIEEVTGGREIEVVADACHALGADSGGVPVGGLAAITAFSFHPVKSITTAEGGMVVTARDDFVQTIRTFRSHGISDDHHARAAASTWEYDMGSLGYNYRLSDLQCALGLSQLTKLDGWIERRRAIAARYDAALIDVAGVTPLTVSRDVGHAYHLYVVRLERPGSQGNVFAAMRRAGIGVNVHYRPVHLHAFYRRTFGTRPGMCPVAEESYGQILSLPMFPALADDDVDRVVEVLAEATDVGG